MLAEYIPMIFQDGPMDEYFSLEWSEARDALVEGDVIKGKGNRFGSQVIWGQMILFGVGWKSNVVELNVRVDYSGSR